MAIRAEIKRRDIKVLKSGKCPELDMSEDKDPHTGRDHCRSLNEEVWSPVGGLFEKD